MKPYTHYRESSSWLGELPAHWHVNRVKYAASIVNEKLDQKPRYLPYLGLENIESKTGRYFPSETENEVNGSVGTFKSGDVLFGKLRPYLAKVVLADFNGCGTTELMVFRPGPETDESYLFYQMISGGFISEVNSLTEGAKMPRATPSDVANLSIAVPPIPEQRAIARFLDYKTRQIDIFIRKKQRMIELLKEERAAIINQAVTRGLDPDIPMKDSGIEWLGEIPAHWDIQSLKRLTTLITNGYVGPTRGILTDGGVKYIQSLHIKNQRIQFNKQYFVSEQWSAKHKRSELQEGDLLIVQTGAIGEVALVTREYQGSNCHALIIARLNRSIAFPTYYLWLLASNHGKHSLLNLQTGALHPHLNSTIICDIPVPVPPLDEQILIQNRIASEAQKIETAISTVIKEIDLIQEYRTALISEAVTGKIDVREYPIPEDAEESPSETVEALTA